MATKTNSTSPHAMDHSLNLLVDTYNYNHWIYSLLRPFLGEELCEIGAGIGNMTRFFLNSSRLTCIEPETEYHNVLCELSSVHLNMEVSNCRLEEYAGQAEEKQFFDSVVCVNVLEHIKDDAGAVSMMASLVKDTGNILIFVPACSWAFGSLDRLFGHYRRYSKKRLFKLARECQLDVIRCRNVNFIGAFGWWWCSRVRRASTLDSQSARLFDRFVPFVSALEKLLPPLTGQSLFTVLKKRQACR